MPPCRPLLRRATPPSISPPRTRPHARAAGAPQKRRAVKLADDTQVFEAGQLGAAPGGGTLTTYKELCSLATELGQPDLGAFGVCVCEGGVGGQDPSSAPCPPPGRP